MVNGWAVEERTSKFGFGEIRCAMEDQLDTPTIVIIELALALRNACV